MTSHMPKNSYTKKTNKLVIFGILRHNLSKFVTQSSLYCSKQLETTLNQVGKKSLHTIFNSVLPVIRNSLWLGYDMVVRYVGYVHLDSGSGKVRRQPYSDS